MTKGSGSFVYKVGSIFLVGLLVLVWALSVWSFYWVEKPAEVLSVSHGVEHVSGRTVRVYRGFSRIQEQHIGYLEIRYRFESGGMSHIGNRVRIGEAFLPDWDLSLPVKAGETIFVYVPYDGSGYSIIHPGLRTMSLFLATAVVALWLIFPKLINWFLLFVMRTLSVRKDNGS